MAAPAPAEHVIPPRLEPVIRRLLVPAGGLPAGWAFVSFRIHGGEVRAAYGRAHDKLVAQLALAHPSAALPGKAAETGKFAVALRASARHAAVRELFEALLANLRAVEPAFEWLRVEAAAPKAAERARADGDEEPEASPLACAREIDHHLDLVPWIDLGVDFDHAACFAEAQALLARFATHQSGLDGEYAPGWKSLAIRAKGGGLHHDAAYGYRVADGPPEESRFTAIAAEVPRTLALLDRLVHLDRVTSARLMVLEPGGVIPVHSDDLSRPVSHSLNVALNMPEGCEFFFDLAPDGASTARTRKAPFRDGAALLLNVAKYHSVINRSAVPRIHLKVEGPLKVEHRAVLALARRQNGADSHAAVCARLVADYRAAGRPIAEGTHLYEDAWKFGLINA